MTKRIAQAILLSLVITVFGVIPAFAAADGKLIYNKSCKVCHAPDAKGTPKLAGSLKVDLAKLDLVDKDTLSKSDAELAKAVGDGIGKMKGFKSHLKVDEINAVVVYIRSLKK